MAQVELENVGKSFGAVSVLRDVSLSIQDGEFLILVGPSGCGKTTLLRMVAGLEEISTGEIRIDGRVVNNLAPKDRDIAMVFQNYALYPHMTVAQNMGYSLRLAGVPKKEREARVGSAAEILGLTELLARKPKQLSGGQRQRVAMGRAIVRDPKVFLFDEPLSNLDAKLRVAMRAEIKALHHRLGSTILYVTHDQIEAMTMADRIVVMNAGSVEQVGTPLELYDHPSNLFVAAFIGSPAMNFFDGRIEASGEGARLILDNGPSFSVPRATGTPRVTAGIRPDKFSISSQADGSFEGRVVVVEPTGAETQVALEEAGKQFVAVFRERINSQPGEMLRLTVEPSQIHLFDKATGLRLPA
jgi:multiple sugar transport system ATP-binding protein